MLLFSMIFIPLFSVLFIFMFRDRQEIIRKIALFSSLLVLGIGIYAWSIFDGSIESFQLGMKFSWFEKLGVSFYLGTDGLSFPLIMLTAILMPLVIYFAWEENKRPALFFSLLLITEAGVLGVFSSLDFFLFYIFWEIVLVPMFFIIGIWGGERKEYASMKFLIYTHIASLVMIIGIFAMYFAGENILGYYTFSIPELTQVAFPIDFQLIWFPVLFFAFAVKLPIIPFHTWLPDAHVEAPTAGSVLLAGVLLKMGGYGMIRIAYLMNESAVGAYANIVIFLGLLNIIYGAFVALKQDDLKKMIAYSSISHMGFVVVGIQSLNYYGLKGAMTQMFAHGLISAALFMACGAIQHSTGTRRISILQGLYEKMPKAMTMMVIAFFASMGMPGFVGFVGEFTVFLGFYKTFGWFVLILGLGMFISVGYYLWSFQRIAYGHLPLSLSNIGEMKRYEGLAISVLLVLIVFFGLQPHNLFELMEGKLLEMVSIIC